MSLNKSSMFAEGVRRLGNGSIDFDTHVIKAVLMRTSFANTTFTDANRDAFDFLDDIPTADRAKDGAFPTLAAADIVMDAANNNVKYADGTTTISFTVVPTSLPVRGVVIFKSSGAESASPVICYNHFTAAATSDGGTVTVTLNADGLFRASYD